MTEEDEKIMQVEVEVKCKKCGKNTIAEVPVSCDAGPKEGGGEALICDIVGDIEDHVPQCSCGSTDFEVKKEEIHDKVKEKMFR